MEEVIVTSENVNQIKIEADIVLTRGLLAEILASLSKNIPVVEITVPAADILRTIRNCVEHYGKQKIGIIAAVSYTHLIYPRTALYTSSVITRAYTV